LVGAFIETHQRIVGIRLRIELQTIFHTPDKRRAHPGNTPGFLLPRLEGILSAAANSAEVWRGRYATMDSPSMEGCPVARRTSEPIEAVGIRQLLDTRLLQQGVQTLLDPKELQVLEMFTKAQQ
jgi:hypothetical protein